MRNKENKYQQVILQRMTGLVAEDCRPCGKSCGSGEDEPEAAVTVCFSNATGSRRRDFKHQSVQPLCSLVEV